MHHRQCYDDDSITDFVIIMGGVCENRLRQFTPIALNLKTLQWTADYSKHVLNAPSLPSSSSSTSSFPLSSSSLSSSSSFLSSSSSHDGPVAALSVANANNANNNNNNNNNSNNNVAMNFANIFGNLAGFSYILNNLSSNHSNGSSSSDLLPCPRQRTSYTKIGIPFIPAVLPRVPLMCVCVFCVC